MQHFSAAEAFGAYSENHTATAIEEIVFSALQQRLSSLTRKVLPSGKQ